MSGQGVNSFIRLAVAPGGVVSAGVGVGSELAAAVGVALGVSSGVAVGTGVASGVGDGVTVGVFVGPGVAVGAAVSFSPRTLPDGEADGPATAAVSVSPPFATTNPMDRRNAIDKDRHRPGDGRGHDLGARDAFERLGRLMRAAQIPWAVDVAAGQADQLLLPQRLRDRLVQCGAAVGRIRHFDGQSEAVVVPDRAQERADPGVRGTVVADGLWAGSALRITSDVGIVGVRDPRRRDRRGILVHVCSKCPLGWNGAESSTFRVLPYAGGRC